MSNDRYPVEVKALGLLKHGKQKVWMLSVAWSDQNNILIYRAFEEFKKLHKDLKRKFPIESGLLKKSDRTIPKFQDINVMLRKNQKLSRCRESLRLLEIYCQELLRTEAKISQGEDVIHFFEAQSRDMDPSFPENSIVILPSEMGERRTETAHPSSATITQPVISQSYRCVEAYETKDTNNKPFKATKEEMLEVLMKDMTGWWLVENDRKQIAWFPAPYLEESEDTAVVRETEEEGMLHYVTWPYKAKKLDELSVKMGVVVEVLEKSDNGWWLVWYNGSAGYVPSLFLQPYRNPYSKFLALANSNLGRSTPNLSQATSPLRKSSPSHQRSYDGGVAQAYSTNRMTEGKEESPPSRARSRSLSGSVVVAGFGQMSETNSLSHSSGNVSGHGYYWPQDPEAKRVGNNPPIDTLLHCASESHGSPALSLGSKEQSDSAFDEEPLGCSDHLRNSSDSEPTPDGPTIPPRPLPHEILQKCTTITRKALLGVLPAACSQGCH
ncbi:NADPH oxidase organizer 1 [Rhineura floridana]|uniref:NADPH oxidase organizer 1 n=1 Tax=Rhineura floridana TaxID=261503 RepID=UPI002AC88625|nr:NADPH oxidase organizer 1 [Rhineura floridana]